MLLIKKTYNKNKKINKKNISPRPLGILLHNRKSIWTKSKSPILLIIPTIKNKVRN